MTFDISFSILSFFLLLFSIFTFSKWSFLGIFHFWLKTPPHCKSCSKNGQNHQFALLSFTFHKKNPLFDVDLFPRTFDMESPFSYSSFSLLIAFLSYILIPFSLHPLSLCYTGLFLSKSFLSCCLFLSFPSLFIS